MRRSVTKYATEKYSLINDNLTFKHEREERGLQGKHWVNRDSICTKKIKKKEQEVDGGTQIRSTPLLLCAQILNGLAFANVNTSGLFS
jgi:hypothetical protein